MTIDNTGSVPVAPQGASLEELQENLRDISSDITLGQVPGARKLAELRVS
jgi:hypothetical protein